MSLKVYSLCLLPLLTLGCDGALNDINRSDKKDKNKEQTSDIHHRIIVDADNAKTSVYLYEYQSKDNALAENIKILSYSSQATGINHLSTTQLSSYLSKMFDDNLLDEIKKATKKQNTEKKIEGIQFYSTSGMRSLSINNRAEINTVIKNWLTDWSKKQNITFTQSIEVKTLSGKEQGIYTWAAYNYQSNQFKSDLAGIVTLGEDTTHLTYEDVNLNNANVTIGNKTYSVYSQSYALGKNDSQSELKNIDECHLLGYTDTARGDYTQCREAAKTYISNKIGYPFQGNQYSDDFGLFAEFFQQAKFFNINDQYSFKHLQDEADVFCHLDWEEAKTKYGHYDPEEMEPHCMMSAFQGALLEDIFNFSDKHNFYPTETINNVKITWPMGALITQKYEE